MISGLRIAGEKCAKCGAVELRCSSVAALHWVRVLRMSRKRFCPSCGNKWHVDPAPVTVHSPWDREAKIVLALALTAAGAVAVLGLLQSHPIDAAKRLVRGQSDDAHGRKSKNVLWSVLGFLYPSKEDAKTDYYGHSRK
ncbi:MAG: hypothetical protein HY927_06460 [Elusimicrobia bacterium]|nr:hypothetical protein [Elusimicrobiota bacterium]